MIITMAFKIMMTTTSIFSKYNKNNNKNDKINPLNPSRQLSTPNFSLRNTYKIRLVMRK